MNLLVVYEQRVITNDSIAHFLLKILIINFCCACACSYHQAPHRADGKKALSKAASAQVLGLGTTYPSRTRKSSVPIHRAHHWGFKSLRPAAPLKTQHLIALREVRPCVCGMKTNN